LFIESNSILQRISLSYKVRVCTDREADGRGGQRVGEGKVKRRGG